MNFSSVSSNSPIVVLSTIGPTCAALDYDRNCYNWLWYAGSDWNSNCFPPPFSWTVRSLIFCRPKTKQLAAFRDKCYECYRTTKRWIVPLGPYRYLESGKIGVNIRWNQCYHFSALYTSSIIPPYFKYPPAEWSGWGIANVWHCNFCHILPDHVF